ncbi:MAG: hypothetical protein QOI25_4905, partial [Mycobacterium sp.]|nr:hypothetical protein [Mycobacterium sp.]
AMWCSRVALRCLSLTAADGPEGGKRAAVGVGELAEVLLGSLDLLVAEPVHHGLEVGTTGEQPRGGGHRAGRGSASAGGSPSLRAQAATPGCGTRCARPASPCWLRRAVLAALAGAIRYSRMSWQSWSPILDRAVLVVLRIATDVPHLVGAVIFFDASSTTRRTWISPVSRSMSTGRSAASSPQRTPVSIATNTSMRYRCGISASIVSNCSGVIAFFGCLTNFGNTVCARGLMVRT